LGKLKNLFRLDLSGCGLTDVSSLKHQPILINLN
jgi:hypothetical protein